MKVWGFGMNFLGKCHKQYKFAYIFKMKSFCNAKITYPSHPHVWHGIFGKVLHMPRYALCLARNFWENVTYILLLSGSQMPKVYAVLA